MEVKSTILRWYHWVVSRYTSGFNLWILYLERPKRKIKVRLAYGRRDPFFYLLYWSDLDIRHCINVMHMEKNVCDSVIRMLLNIQGKTKDGLNTRQDLAEMGIWSQLHPRSDGKKIYLPPTCHTLSKEDKISFCQCLLGWRFHRDTLQILRALCSWRSLSL